MLRTASRVRRVECLVANETDHPFTISRRVGGNQGEGDTAQSPEASVDDLSDLNEKPLYIFR